MPSKAKASPHLHTPQSPSPPPHTHAPIVPTLLSHAPCSPTPHLSRYRPAARPCLRTIPAAANVFANCKTYSALEQREEGGALTGMLHHSEPVISAF